jgi:hypothetical protein
MVKKMMEITEDAIISLSLSLSLSRWFNDDLTLKWQSSGIVVGKYDDVQMNYKKEEINRNFCLISK